MKRSFLTIGTGTRQRTIAVERQAGSAPGLFWLGGFRSVMTGDKATALSAHASAVGASFTRFDYSGCGQSSGQAASSTISDWLEEAITVLGQTPDGPQILVGSSMGAWLALLLNRHQQREGRAERIAGIILVAPAVDMTRTLIAGTMSIADRRQLKREGHFQRPSRYGPPVPITRAFIEDGDRHCLLGTAIETGCPVTIVHGVRDEDVPVAHATDLAAHIVNDPLTMTLVPEGDHRLSRPDDLALIIDAVERLRGG